MHKPSSCKPLQEWSSGSGIHSANTSGVRYLGIRKKTHGLSFGEVTARLGHPRLRGFLVTILTPPGLLGQGTECSSPCFTPTMEKAESAREPELLATGLGPSRYAFLGLGRNWQCRVWPSGGLHDEGEETALSRGHKSMKTGCCLGNVSAHLCLLILGASAVWLCGSGPGRQDQTALVRAQLRLLSMLTSVKQAESHPLPT